MKNLKETALPTDRFWKLWTQKTLFPLAGKIIISRSYVSVASTFFLITASLLPYADLFLDPIVDTSKIKLNRFPNLATAIWSYSMCTSPLLILVASKFNPYKFAYIVPIYVYTTMFCGFFFLDMNIHISSDWVFRLITFALSFILLILGWLMVKIWKVVRIKEEVMDEMIKIKKHG